MNHTLLSKSLYNDLTEIFNKTQCIVTKALLDAYNNDCNNVTDYARMITVRYDGDEDEIDASKLMFSFLPKNKEPQFGSNGNWKKDNRQTAKPVRVVQALLENSDDVTIIPQVKNSINGRYYAYQLDPKLKAYNILEDSMNTYTLYDEKGIAVSNIGEDTFLVSNKRNHKHITRRFKDSDYEKFVNSLKAHYQCDLEFRLLEGTDISKYYNARHYLKTEGHNGTLNDSCMRTSDESFFQIYVENCKMLTAFICNKVVGRAIVWETNEGTFMDRIYYSKDYITDIFIDYAKNKKWLYKSRQTSGSDTEICHINSKGVYIQSKLSLNMTIKSEYDEYPYMDTMSYLDIDSLVIHNDNLKRSTHYLTSTSGNADESDWYINNRVCYASGVSANTADMRYIERLDEYALPEFCVRLYDSQWALMKDAICLKSNYYYKNDTVKMSNGNIEYIYSPDIITVNGKWIYKVEHNMDLLFPRKAQDIDLKSTINETLYQTILNGSIGAEVLNNFNLIEF